MNRRIRKLVVCAGMLAAAQAHAQSINKVEYFIDADPGHGLATNVPVAAGMNIQNLAVNANVASIANGVHTLCLRSRTANGKWSQTNTVQFAKVQLPFSNPNAIANIVAAEYFYDIDPGEGAGVNIPLTPAADISALVFNADVSALATGVHALVVRTKDAAGKWSIANRYLFAKVQGVMSNPNTAGTINKIEYFFDTDPGEGAGVDVPVAASGNIAALNINASVAALPSGLHKLYIRSRNSQGRWSITNEATFSKILGLLPNTHLTSKIMKAEYYFDTDPGEGAGIAVPFTQDTSVSFVFNADVSALAAGVHTMFVRVADSLGQWSIANTLKFARVQAVLPNPHTADNITGLEYFFDTDPGEGAGVSVSVTAAADISNLGFNAGLTGLANGVHTMYVRSKDAAGKWSINNRHMFALVQNPFANPHLAGTVAYVEYFVDTDPGFGSGTSVSVAASADISGLMFNVDMTPLAETNHVLYVRTRNSQGRWSITNTHSFYGGLIPLSMRLISFDARAQQDKTVKLDWVTEAERDVAHYTIERSSDAKDWTFVGKQIPDAPTSSSRHNYSMIDEAPGRGIIYYRLTETDLAGRATTAPVRFVYIDSDAKSFATLYPNPNDGKQLSISTDLFSAGLVTITIIGADGRLHLRETVNDRTIATYTLLGLNLAAGSYFVNLQGATRSESLKLIVAGDSQ